MAQTYTLEEAAGKLGLPADEFKRRWKTEWTSLRTFRDGATVRFRTADIDELARSLGMASDPGLQLGTSPGSSTEYLVPTDDAIGDDIFTPSASDSTRRRGKPADSDIRLEADGGPRSSRRRAADVPTEELSLDLSMPESGIKKSSAGSKKLSAPKTGPNLAKPSPAETDSSSEFELSLDNDSDSFELNLNPTDDSDEVDLGGSQIGKRTAQSGINLAKPSDSGVSLESEDDFELSLDAEPESPSRRDYTGPKSVKMSRGEATASDSEFELSLEENSGVTDALAEDAEQGDIFETDFELPADESSDLESGSEVVAVENSDTDLENSDFDLALDESDIQPEDESASQVVLLDDEESAPKSGRLGKAAALAGGAALAGAAARKRRRMDDDEDDAIDLEDDDASSQLRDVPRRRVDDEDDAAPIGEYKAKPWGILPAIVLLPAFLLTFLGGLMSYELVRGMWSYQHGSKPGGALVRGVADMFDMKTTD
jgi:hypothetical protein